MAPRIVRPRSDSPYLPLTVGLGIAFLVVGYLSGARIFRPGIVGPEGSAIAEFPESPPGSVPEAPVPGTAASDAAVPPPSGAPSHPNALPAVPVASVQVSVGTPAGCGDGEEIDRVAANCDTPAGLEPALRAHLAAVASCPAAAAAARTPAKALSLGLRVNYDRRQIAVLIGRSTNVPDRVSYQACTVDLLRSTDDVWQTHGAHPRYLFYYTLHFSPPGTPVPVAVPTPAPVPTPVPVRTPAPVPTPVPVAAPAVAPPVPPVTVPALPDLLRRPATGHATVAWEHAVIRDAPRDGAIVGRIAQGTEVELLDRRGSWWAVRWDHDHAGWVFREAIGQPP